jgi:iron complex outermembrane receptor protein
MSSVLPNYSGRNRTAIFLARAGVSVALGLAAALLVPAQSPSQTATSRDLTQLSLEDLMNVEVTSVSKKEQKLSKTGAAIFVITQEDIRRSGATNVPDLLRMVPGVEVAQVNANRWAISIRGFNSLYANKILLLIDGRSIYNITSSSVFWDQEIVPLEDIDRIEIIRGPGGTMWGANAVNGVINIITLRTKDTQGGLLRAGTGSPQNADGLAQYGGAIGSVGTYRAYGRYFNTESSTGANGVSADDGWHGSSGGFRSDWNLTPRDSLTVQGDISATEAAQTITTVIADALPLEGTFTDRMTNTTANVLGRWDHTLSNGSDTSLQVFYDYNHRAANGQVDELHRTGELDFQHHVAVGAHNDVVWGLGYRFDFSDLLPGYAVTIAPAKGTTSLYSTFVQDEFKLTESLSLTFGSKFEHNSFTGFEYEPSAQLVWSATGRQTLWASAARAIRQPNLVDFGVDNEVAIAPLGGPAFGVVTILGSPLVKAEQLLDYEAGYRAQLRPQLSVDLALFLSYYHDLETQEPQAPYFVTSPGPPHLVIPLVFENLAHAQDHGAELVVAWEATRRWKLSPGYSWLDMSVVRDPTSQDSTIMLTPGYSPKNHFQIRSLFNVSKNIDWDTTLQYVSNLTTGSIPSYTRLDTRLGWRPRKSMEISIVGQNLLRPLHFEFPDSFGLDSTQVERSVFGKITWRF